MIGEGGCELTRFFGMGAEGFVVAHYWLCEGRVCVWVYKSPCAAASPVVLARGPIGRWRSRRVLAGGSHSVGRGEAPSGESE